MADADNNIGGCGTFAENVEVCIVPGTDNPLTNNEEYECNTDNCSLGECCLNGNYTLPCGGVSTILTNAEQAPNCDLNDFNQPGDPINGDWIIDIYDVCQSDTGTLVNCTLQFACDVAQPNDCFADGGNFPTEISSHCWGSPALDINVAPIFCSGDPPPSDEYGYIFFIVRNDTILAEVDNPDLSTYPLGSYSVKGFSYELSSQAQTDALVGKLLSDVLSDFQPNEEPFCGSFSGNQIFVDILGDPLNSTCEDIVVNAGPDQELNCSFGNNLSANVNHTNGDLCDKRFVHTPNGDTLNHNSFTLFGVDEPGLYIFTFYHPFSGCLVSDTVEILQPSSPIVDAGPDTLLPCWTSEYWVQGSVTTSGGNAADYFWTDSGGNVLSDSLALHVTGSGTYILHGDDPAENCESSDEVQIIIPPTIIDSVATMPAGCGQADGTAMVVVGPSTSDVEYAWSTGGNTQTIGGLAQGWHSVTVSDDFCSYHQNFYVDEDLSCKVIISGHVWDDDVNQDCILDGTTVPPTGPILLHLLPADIYTYTMPDGSYEFIVDAGDYTINYVDEDEYELLCPASGQIAVSLPSNGSASDGNDFFAKRELETNVCISMCQGVARPGFLQGHHFMYCNLGEAPVDVEITLHHDPILTDFDLADVADTYDPVTDMATWSIPQVQPNECGTIYFKLGVPSTTPIGTPLSGAVSIEPVDDDIYPSNNLDDWIRTVTASYDPNVKTSQTGDDQWGGPLADADSIISYQVLFQNTGTDTAYTVVVRDTLDENLDVTTIRPGVASHDYFVQFEGNNVLIFNFLNILLPDSTTNPAASQGFATFTIKRRPDLLPGTEILNRAGIYFDFNTPVITNHTLHYIPLPVVTAQQSVSICEGENYAGLPYFEGTTLMDTLHFPTYDSVTVTVLTVQPHSESEVSMAVCEGETVSIGGQSFGTAGQHVVTLQNSVGCDSVVTLTLGVLPTSSYSFAEQICMGSTYFFGGEMLGDAGTFEAVFQNMAGCDSLVTLTLGILPATTFSFAEQICAGDTYFFNGETLDETGVYEAILQNEMGCDSIATLTLEILPSDASSFAAQICKGEHFDFGGEILTETGVYESVFQNVLGCDSTVTLMLEVLLDDVTAFEQQICEGQSYVFDGNTLTQPGMYNATFQNADGCDSLVTLQLDVLPSLTEEITAGICAGESFLFNGEALTEEGVYTAEMQSTGGCDSIAILQLSVLQPSSFSFSETICEGEIFNFNGEGLSEPGSYEITLSNTLGCDSTVALTLGVFSPSELFVDAEICAGESYFFNGETLTEAGTYEYVLQNVEGCDSTVHLDLTVWEGSTATVEAEICQGTFFLFYGDSLTVQGEYTQTLSGVAGCDSTILLTLAVTAPPEITEETAVPIGTEVFGIPVFSDTTFSQNMLDENGCEFTLITEVSVFVNTDEATALASLTISPNPNSGQFRIDFGPAEAGSFETLVYDLLGRRVFTLPGRWFSLREKQTLQVDIGHLPAGVYWLEMRSEKGRAAERFVKQ